MKYADQKVKSISELIQKLKKDCRFHKGPIWFRGQTKKEHKLVPSFYRTASTVSEMTLIKKFKQNATLLVAENYRDDFDWLFVMQHHGVHYDNNK